MKLSLILIVTTMLVASQSVWAEPQKWCQSAELIPVKAERPLYTANDLPSDGPLFKHRKFDGKGHYEIFVSADGRVKQCNVLESSGERALDASGCSNLKRRSRFNPLADPACHDVVRVKHYWIRYAWDHDYKWPDESAPHLLTGVL
jgi:hypothetical protein